MSYFFSVVIHMIVPLLRPACNNAYVQMLLSGEVTPVSLFSGV